MYVGLYVCKSVATGSARTLQICMYSMTEQKTESPQAVPREMVRCNEIKLGGIGTGGGRLEGPQGLIISRDSCN